MTFTMLRDFIKKIHDNVFFSIMADKATDSSNNEQLVVCIKWVDNNFDAHEDLIGIHAVENVKSDILVTVLKYILRLNIPLSNCRGQCYDGASNKTVIKHGVAAQIQSESPLAFLTHSYCHPLNLAVNDMIKEDRLVKNTVDTTSALSKLIKKSPKRGRMLQKIRDDLSLECPGLRILCSTR